MKKKPHAPAGPAAPPPSPGAPRSLPGDPFPIGVYPVFDDDLPRDSAFENFAAPDLRDAHPYPWGLE